ncbi:MAG: arsenate reductase (thioredoxin) [Liquorilactobacillus hordei]|uniref:Arsenate reductase (Thioredoxin) n=1 Tax=Liquorilactobacillus hordei TaxID=468911 RepID=A0A3S6QNN1_9LACO|nr:arsenate reductase (thioredoxin) [Liquorilactobacillus hordei]AUJ29478.1 arsenate reductase (thioredoxin) [Liquorilactobacillus hordei]
MKKIYFLCTGNSCRSQMAEGYARVLLPQNEFEIRSAGVEVHGLNSDAVKVMLEDGVDISGQYSKKIDVDYFKSADLIITLCGDAKDKCPVISAETQHLHYPLADPVNAVGSYEERLDVFRNVRDKIKKIVHGLE